MSKELVVSSTRHETRVALLEDDQVVEIYYQREKEYSLAGSIHKGRVTRVLPGMQSAFVDIGLDRDAFLYVSDFFEDNDEYDKVVTERRREGAAPGKGRWQPAVMAPVVLATAAASRAAGVGRTAQSQRPATARQRPAGCPRVASHEPTIARAATTASGAAAFAPAPAKGRTRWHSRIQVFLAASPRPQNATPRAPAEAASAPRARAMKTLPSCRENRWPSTALLITPPICAGQTAGRPMTRGNRARP